MNAIFDININTLMIIQFTLGRRLSQQSLPQYLPHYATLPHYSNEAPIEPPSEYSSSSPARGEKDIEKKRRDRKRKIKKEKETREKEKYIERKRHERKRKI